MPRPGAMPKRIPVWVSAFVLLVSFVIFNVPGSLVNGQQFAIFAPPATPTSIEVFAGPPPTPANLEAQPLPPVPDPALGTQTFTVSNTPPDGTTPSIPVPANFLGLSLELSVANNFVGDKIGEPAYQLLNYLDSIRVRAGRGPTVRIGGNTQDTAVYDEKFTGIIEKTGGGISSSGVPITPNIEYGDLIFHLIEQMSSAVDAEVIFGVNMVNNTAPFTVPMIHTAHTVLGQNLQYYLVGNEPDRYEGLGKRPVGYTIENYLSEWGALTDELINSDYSDDRKKFAGPAVCCQWTTQQVLDAGLSTQYADRLATITAIQYPQSLCSTESIYGHAGYMSHQNVINFASYDTDAVATAVGLNIPYVLVETSTASCVGVADVSDTFTSAVWGVDMAMQTAYRNHTGVLLHSGGQTALYNTFTPPAFNASNRIVSAKAWRTGPIFYSTLVVAEALRPSDGSAKVTVTDQQLGNDVAVAYNIYENGVAARQIFINMVNDPSGANNMQVSFPQPTSQPASVPYKILAAPSLAEKDNITWAGQSFGWWSEGFLKGEETILQAPCTDGQCSLSVPAPGVALAFLNQNGAQEATVSASAFHPVGTQNPQVVLQSNGERGRRGGATSRGSAMSAASPRFSFQQNIVSVRLSALVLSIAFLFVYM